MIIANIYEIKAKLSEYLDAVSRGERVLICKRNRPVAELRLIASARTAPRPIGGASGRLQVPDAFLEPLPDEFVSAFYEESPADAGTNRVAEQPDAEAPRRPGATRQP